MKPKKIDKRLTLNKKTISNLENKAMNHVVGGAPSILGPCETWGPDSCDAQCYSEEPPAICADPTFNAGCSYPTCWSYCTYC